MTAMRRSGRGNDREAEPAPADVAVPRLVEAHEPAEHPLAVLWVQATAVVVDAQGHHLLVRFEANVDAVHRVASGVVQEVDDQASQRADVTLHLAGCDVGDDLDVGTRPAKRVDGLADQAVEIDEIEVSPPVHGIGSRQSKEAIADSRPPSRTWPRSLCGQV